jgi:class 3 adenylate cyclase
MTAGMACGSCGTDLRENAKFCDECGAPTAVSGDTAEYKQVTALFADVVRSMHIAAAVDVERFREIMTELVERSAAVVQRYGGGSVEYTGDGLMALFGAPVALEDHAFRGCLAALAIQEEANRLAVEVQHRDGVALRLRVGLNSGRVIAGEIGSGSLGYAATGQPVGLAQRMESVAPPGGVMLSESTARLVEHLVVLAGPEWVRIKGADEPVRARRLVGIGARNGLVGRAEASLVGRRWEMAALDAMVDRAMGGRGAVVNVVGAPGIGKSRTAREVAALAAGRGVEVFWAFCESHARDVPFHAVTRLLRARSGVADLRGHAARTRVRQQIPDADPQDLLLLDDLLGIADPDMPLPQIDPEARRRRLTALINTASLARTEPALFIIEDAHWIDAVSESMIADFLTVIPRTSSLVLMTSRPEYEGALTRVHGAQTIALAALGDSDTAALLGELLGSDPSVGELAAIIAERADGNPFFAEEMVRELVQRGVLAGARGGYVCRADVAEVSVPATVQAAIAARIDRLSTRAKQTLNAASVIGARFGAELLAALGVDAVVDELLSVELIDQVRFTPSAEYAFHHPLIRAVAYESQLKSNRAELHRRLAAVIQERALGSVEENAALIAEHLQAAGELHAAYAWHMRAGAWSANRDIGAARVSWERARRIADALPDYDPDQLSMRIAPRTMLCGTAWRVHMNVAGARFDELRKLCTAAGDKASLAIAMAGLVMDHTYHARIREASRRASEAMALVESVGDPNLTVGLSVPVIYAKIESAEWSDVLRWSQTVIDLADDDPSKGNLLVGSPLSVAFTSRGMARWCLGRPGWRDDQRHGLAMALSADPLSLAAALPYVYFLGIPHGVLRPDDFAVREIEDSLRIAERSSDDLVLANARMTLGVALVHRHTAAERDRGRSLLAEVGEVFVRREHNLADLPIVEVYVARERARRGERDEAIPLMRAAVDHLFREGRLLVWGVTATGVLVETLLNRSGAADVAEAQAAIERLAAAPAEDGLAVRDIWLLRLRALLARAHGDAGAYAHLRDRYCAMAESLGFEGHIDWAEAMIEGGQ